MAIKTKIGALQVEDIMTRDPVSVTRGDDVRELATIFGANEISAAPVVDMQGRVIGVVSKTDLIRHCIEDPFGSRGESFWTLLGSGTSEGMGFEIEDLGTVDEIMTCEPVTARPDESITVVAKRMANEHVHRVVVIDPARRPIGIVSTLDVLAVFGE